MPANLPVPEKIEPGLRRARGPWSGTVGSVELVAELHEHLAPDRAVCAPEERIRVERIVLRVQLVEDVVHEQAARGVVRYLLLRSAERRVGKDGVSKCRARWLS